MNMGGKINPLIFVTNLSDFQRKYELTICLITVIPRYVLKTVNISLILTAKKKKKKIRETHV